MHVDSTPGPVRVVAMHRSEEDIRKLVDAQADRARFARSLAGPGQSESAPVPMGSGTPLAWSSHQNAPRDAGSASSTPADDAES